MSADSVALELEVDWCQEGTMSMVDDQGHL
ncbi:hypothetical protein A2U01_0047420, partial [Trifolium medium]|nr:hypothetical protein [Trifolium medium]